MEVVDSSGSVRDLFDGKFRGRGEFVRWINVLISAKRQRWNAKRIDKREITKVLKMESEAETLNKIERKVMKGTASDREKRLLVEAYNMHGVIMSRKLVRILGG